MTDFDYKRLPKQLFEALIIIGDKLSMIFYGHIHINFWNYAQFWSIWRVLGLLGSRALRPKKFLGMSRKSQKVLLKKDRCYSKPFIKFLSQNKLADKEIDKFCKIEIFFFFKCAFPVIIFYVKMKCLTILESSIYVLSTK